jgi:LPS-assembly protein
MAQTEGALKLKPTPKLAEEVSSDPQNRGPDLHLWRPRVGPARTWRPVIDGNAELRRGATSIRADRIEYYQPDDQMKSRGNVRINRAGNRFEGPELELKLDRFEGFFTTPDYRFLSNGGNGRAERVDFLDEKHLTAQRASYTTCERDDEASWKPAWVLRASSFEFDLETEVGVANAAVVRFKSVPILAFPKISFPLSDKRKSGLLPPTISMGSTNGFEFRQPYYFNIAPNRDATFSPAS